MDSDIKLTSEDIRRLLELFSICHYKTKENDKRTDSIQKLCIGLFAKDSEVIVINNENGELATSYPSKIIIPQINDSFTQSNHQQINDMNDSFDEVDGAVIKRSNTLTNGSNGDNYTEKLHKFSEIKRKVVNHHSNGNSSGDHRDGVKRLDVNKLKDLINRARVARCRARFPVPVILLNGKYICRSATLSGGPEIFGRSGLEYLFNDYRNNSDYESNKLSHNLCEDLSETVATPTSTHGLSLNISDTSQLFNKVRNQDIKLLKYLSVGYICDLMVEKKKVKFGMNVTSSEKADKESRYSDFNIMSLPYPGCEFFKDFRDNGYSAEGLIYDWNQHFVDAHLIVPKNDRICDRLSIDWKQYRSWDVIKLTQNYLKLLLLYFNESDSSILIHCISGWDRTPLFMSLLRLSLWADGKVHQQLGPIEITFLTIAYDWFLFGHNLNDRLNKGEEILFFCFYFLKYITTEEFSIDFLINNNKERKHSMEELLNCHDSQLLLEENQIYGRYGGSSTSLNSSCSTTSSKSHDNYPPIYFPTFNTSNPTNDFFTNSEETCDSTKSESDFTSSYGKTPPTLTNSEEGSTMFSFDSNSTIINKCDESIAKIPKKINFNGLNTSNNCKSTEPVAIPSQKKVVQNSDNSVSSLSRSDSWQLVSDTGSIRECCGRYSNYSPDSLSSPKRSVNSTEGSSSSDHSEPKLRVNNKSETNKTNGLPKPNYQIRKEKLQSVRSIFYNAYSAGVGFKFKNGCDSTRFSSLIDQFAGTVGIYPSRVTAPQ